MCRSKLHLFFLVTPSSNKIKINTPKDKNLANFESVSTLSPIYVQLNQPRYLIPYPVTCQYQFYIDNRKVFLPQVAPNILLNGPQE
jgi:hypothetical protein